MGFSALDSELLGGLVTTREMAALFSDRRRIAAMIRVESALARAQIPFDLAPPELAETLDRITADAFDLAALGRDAALSGVPVIPFVKALQKLLPKELEPFLHRGATTQDIADTAMSLIVRDALGLIVRDLDEVLAGLSDLARRHRSTPCIGRTYGQQAAPISFGYRAAVWLAGVADAAAQAPSIRHRCLTASYGGPVGNLASLGDQGPAALAAFANVLGLRAPPIAWHTRRGSTVALGSWLVEVMGALAKIATDVSLLSSTEVGEVAEPYLPGRGGSSAMPHKRNPVSCTVILAAAQAANGLASGLFASMAAAQERPAGAWHAEWHALPQLFGLAAGALAEAGRLARGLTIDPSRMAANMNLTRGLIFADAAAGLLAPLIGRAAAHDLVEKAAAEVRDRDVTLIEAILADPGCPPGLTRGALAAAFDPAPAVAASAAWVEPVVKLAEETRAQLAKAD